METELITEMVWRLNLIANVEQKAQTMTIKYISSFSVIVYVPIGTSLTVTVFLLSI